MRPLLFTAILVCLSITNLLSQTIDTTFNPIIETPGFMFNGVIVDNDALVIQGDIGSVSGVRCGSSVVKITKEGTLDPSFQSSGITGESFDMVAQPDGKVIMSGILVLNGNSLKLLLRLNQDGTLDESFNPRPNEQPDGSTGFGFLRTLGLQSDGKIIVGGDFTSFGQVDRAGIARLNTDGSLDETFSPTLTFSPHLVAIQPDDKILVYGDGMLIRLSADGSVDNSFSLVSFNSFVGAIDFQSDGRIIVGGLFSEVNSQLATKIARISDNGNLDETFEAPATITNVQDLTVSPDDKITAIGNFYGHVIRLEVDGQIDPLFQVGEGLDTKAMGVTSPNLHFATTQTDGSVIVGGNFSAYQSNVRMSLVRINNDGVIDETYDPRLAASHTGIRDVEPVSDGKVMLAGNFLYVNGQHTPGGVVRLNADGSTDQSFDVSGLNWKAGYVRAISEYPGGEILLGGYFTIAPNVFDVNDLVKVTAQGQRDQNFTGFTGITSEFGSLNLFDLFVQEDGKAILAGQFTQVNGVDRKSLARINADGSLDASFHAGGTDFSELILDISVDSNTGKILILNNNNGGTVLNVLEVANADGSRDDGFEFTGKVNPPWVHAATWLSDESILAGGQFIAFDNEPVLNLVKISGQAIRDNSFHNPDTINSVSSLFKTKTHKILVGTYSNDPSKSALRIIYEDGTSMPINFNVQGNVSHIATDGDQNFYLAGSELVVDNSFKSNGLLRLNSSAHPNSPTALAAQEQVESITLTWSATDTIAAFEVERSVNNNSHFQFIGVSNNTSFIDTLNLMVDSTYYYRVRQVGLSTNGEFSNEVTASLILPAPTALTATGQAHTIELSWESNLTTEPLYEIERSVNANTNFTLHGTSSTTTFIDSVNVIRDSVYHYRVRAVGLSNESAFSNEASADLLMITQTEKNQENQISVYPNPFSKTFTLHNHSDKRIETSILNYAGQEVWHSAIDAHSVTDVGNLLPVGFYILRTSRQGKNSTIKLIKK